MFFPGDTTPVSPVGGIQGSSSIPDRRPIGGQSGNGSDEEDGRRGRTRREEGDESPRSPNFPRPRLGCTGNIFFNRRDTDGIGLPRFHERVDDIDGHSTTGGNSRGSGMFGGGARGGVEGATDDGPPWGGITGGTTTADGTHVQDDPFAPGAPAQASVIYQPVAPPSNGKLEAWRRHMYITDKFKKPMEDLTAATEMNLASMCTVCRYSTVGAGENMQTIMKIYHDNMGIINITQVYMLIVNFWNKYIAGAEIEKENPDPYFLSPNSRKRKRRTDLSGGQVSSSRNLGHSSAKAGPENQSGRKKGGESESESDSDSEAQEDSGAEEDDEEDEEDDMDDGSSSGSDSGSDDNSSQADEDSDAEEEDSVSHNLLSEDSDYERIPTITMAMVDYHFTHCYREQNAQRIIFDQMAKLSEMQSIIYNGGVFCKRRKVTGASGETSSSSSSETDRTRRNLHQISELDFSKEMLAELENMIQEETIHTTHLKTNLRNLKRQSTSKRTTESATLCKLLETTIASKELSLKASMERYADMSKRIRSQEASLASAMENESPNDLSGDDYTICLKMREAILVQSLSRSIIQLLEKANNYSKKRSQVPFGLSAEEYYKTTPMLETEPTANDRSVLRGRQRDFGARNTFVDPALLTMAQNIYSRGGFVPSGGGRGDVMLMPPGANGYGQMMPAEFSVGGTGMKAREVNSKTRRKSRYGLD